MISFQNRFVAESRLQIFQNYTYNPFLLLDSGILYDPSEYLFLFFGVICSSQLIKHLIKLIKSQPRVISGSIPHNTHQNAHEIPCW